ncbi:DUF5658 family protein [Sporosarcina saromensis]|uniref:DUF5658 family protein n=1 Tax=Sporosarcina saromensis TaxID=359365 RepID=A0ABU4G7H9_9BACL|nr:DUF5658 family protein [Sporosarcina saromensis]MDW0112924.1 DUF5658 family protein [Sporosarcina saromensis]
METVDMIHSSKNRIVHTSFLLACLCIIDAVFTDIGIRQGHIEELNPIMRFVHDKSILLFYGMKILLPAILLTLIQFAKTSTILKYTVLFALIIYVVIVSMHIYWIIIVMAFL